jgi:hypothetical protein
LRRQLALYWSTADENKKKTKYYKPKKPENRSAFSPTPTRDFRRSNVSHEAFIEEGTRHHGPSFFLGHNRSPSTTTKPARDSSPHLVKLLNNLYY